MFDRVLVGIDGREGGRDALALARQLSPEGELTLATVYHPSRRPTAEHAAVQRHEATRTLTRERDAAHVAATLRVVGDASAGRGLGRLAEGLGADLLVVGATRRGLFGRVCLGDDTMAALECAPCALAIAPLHPGRQGQPMERIGVGFDGQPESRRALAVARRLAREHGARVSALQIVRIPVVLTGGGPAPLGITIEDLTDAASHQPGDLDARAVYGQTGEELSRFSRELDLLVVGSRGLGPLDRLLRGSTSHQLARHAHCPLLVVPRSRSDAADARDA